MVKLVLLLYHFIIFYLIILPILFIVYQQQ